MSISAVNGHFEATKTLLLLGAPVTMYDVGARDFDGDTLSPRRLRATLKVWAAAALLQHRTFHKTFLCGCFSRSSTSTIQQTSTIIPLQQPISLTATTRTMSECPPMRSYDATGARVTTTTTTTVTLTAVTTIMTQTRTTNPCLPLLAGEPGLLEEIAAFVGIVVGAELRHTRAMGPAIAAVDWAAHDEAWPAAAAQGPIAI